MDNYENRDYIRLCFTHNFVFINLIRFKFLFSKNDETNNEHFCNVEVSLLKDYFIFIVDAKRVKRFRVKFQRENNQPLQLEQPRILERINIPEMSSPNTLRIFIGALSIDAQRINIENVPTLNTFPLELNIENNLKICQTHLNQQIQLHQTQNQ